MKELQSGTAKLKKDFDPFFDDPASPFNVLLSELERETEEEEAKWVDGIRLTTKYHNREPEASDFEIRMRQKRIVRQLSNCSLVRIAKVMDVILCHMTTDELCNLRDVSDRTTNAIMATPTSNGEQLTPDALSLIEDNKVIDDLISDVLLRRAGG